MCITRMKPNLILQKTSLSLKTTPHFKRRIGGDTYFCLVDIESVSTIARQVLYHIYNLACCTCVK